MTRPINKRCISGDESPLNPDERAPVRRRPLTLLDVGVPVGAVPVGVAARERQRRGLERQDRLGTTPLMRAAKGGAVPLVRNLLALGARPNARDGFDNTALLYACAGGAGYAPLAVVRLLIAHGADVRAANDYGYTALHYCIGTWRGTTWSGWAWEGHPHGAALARVLLDRGARVDAHDGSDGKTPLMQAAFHGSVAVARVLLARGADVDRATPSGSTALMIAARRGHAAVAALLLAAGADASARSRSFRGETALGHARRRGHGAVVALLEAAGVRE